MLGGCEVCGSVRNLHEHRGRWLCSTHCHRDAWATQLLLSVLTLVGSVVVVWWGFDHHLAASVVAVLAAATVRALLHQAAHAVVAVVAGVRVAQLGIGVGPRLLSFRVGPVPFTVAAIPATGPAELRPRGDPHARRWKVAYRAVVAAGVGTDAVVFALAVAGSGLFAHALMLVTGYALVSDVSGLLWRTPFPGGLPHTDVHDLVAGGPVPVVSDTPEGWALSWDEYWDLADEVVVALRAEDPVSVAPQIERLRRLAPDNVGWAVAEALVVGNQGRWAEARELFRALGDAERLADTRENGIAYASAIEGTELDEAAELVARVLERTPDEPAYVGTAALVAARRGELDEAERLAARAESLDDRPIVRAEAAVVRAYVAAARGDTETAARHEAAARALLPGHPALRVLA